MNRNNNNFGTVGTALLVAVLVVASVFVTPVMGASASGVTIDGVTDETTTDGTVQVAFNVTADSATTANLTQIEVNGSTATLSQSVSNETVTLHTSDYNLSDLALDGTINVSYTVDNTSYTESVAYDVDADDDGVSDSNDAYPDTAPTTYSVNASENETVASAYVEADNGSFDVTVYGLDADGDRTEVGTDSFTVGSTELAEVTVTNGSYDAYDIDVEGNATVTNHGLIYESNSGGGSTDPSGISQTQLIGGLTILVGLGGLVYLRD